MNPLNSNKENEIIKVLGYFDYFKFPLKMDEIHQFISIKIDKNELSQLLIELELGKKIHQMNGCYLLSNNEQMVERKTKGFALYQKRMKRARRIAGIINSFPFIRMVSVSGSLSKGYADKTTDIDFFILTTNNNLWTSRTLLHLLKKLTFLVNLQHSFCMNYFLSENHLELEEKNYYTAIELSTLIPIKGNGKYKQLMESNNWIVEYLPNFSPIDVTKENEKVKGGKWLFEILLKSSRMNKSLMDFTNNRWRKKWKKRGYPEEDYDLAFKTTLFVSKNHEGNYQKKLLQHVEEVNETITN